MWVLGAFLIFGTLPRIDAARPIKPVAAAVREALGPGVPLIGYRISDHQTLLFYVNRQVEWLDDPVSVRIVVCRGPRTIVVGRPQELEPLQQVLVREAPVEARTLIAEEELAAVEITRTARCTE